MSEKEGSVTAAEAAEAQQLHRDAALAGYAPMRDEAGVTQFGWSHVCPICCAIWEADDQHAQDCLWRTVADLLSDLHSERGVEFTDSEVSDRVLAALAQVDPDRIAHWGEAHDG